jgi:hypothetical protein
MSDDIRDNLSIYHYRLLMFSSKWPFAIIVNLSSYQIIIFNTETKASFTFWQKGILTKWQNGILTKWQKDILTKWQNGILTKWQNGILTKWHFDKMSNGWNDKSPIKLYVLMNCKIECMSDDIRDNSYIYRYRLLMFS